MAKVLVTGATGNVGAEVVRSLIEKNISVKSAIFTEADRLDVAGSEEVLFDFADEATWGKALAGVDAVFLMRPPAISDVKKYLFPFIDATLEKGIQQIVFLSLQGVQYNFLTPHFKVEKYLKKQNAPYTFLRPNFFMQNLNTFYKDDIKQCDEIFLPAGTGKTAFVDVRDIGDVAGAVLTEKGHIQQAYTLSGPESLDYYQVAQTMSEVLQRDITYQNPSVNDYVARLQQQGAHEDFIKVQKMLYFVVRHNFSAGVQSDIESIIGRAATTFEQYVRDYSSYWK